MFCNSIRLHLHSLAAAGTFAAPFLTLAFLVFASQNASLYSHPAADDEKPFVTGPEELLKEGRTSWIDLPVPQRVLSPEIERWSELMKLDDGQLGFFKQLHQEYLQSSEKLRRSVLPPLWQRSADVADRIDEWLTIDGAETRHGLMEDTRAAINQIIEHEQSALFGKLEPVLNADQYMHLQRIRDLRLRQIFMSWSPMLPGATIDLSLLIDAKRRDGHLVTKNSAVFEELLTMYERALTEQHRMYFARIFDLRGRGGVYRAREFQQGTIFQPGGRFVRLAKQVVRVEEAIIQLNDLYCSMLAEHLEAESAQPLIDEYRNVAFPDVYPNEYDIGEIVSVIRGLEILEENQLESVEAVAEYAGDRQTTISNQLIRNTHQWKAKFATSFEVDTQERAAHNEELNRLYVQRRAAAEESLDYLLSILSEPQQEAVQPHIVQFWRRADSSRKGVSD